MKELEKLITELAVTSGKSENEIIEDLRIYASVKFGRMMAENELNIITTLKDKIIINIYREPRHEIIMRNEIIEKNLRFDKLDMKYLNQALEELFQENLIKTDYIIKLTEDGILKAKKLLGEIY